MNLFKTKITAQDADKVTTIEKKRLAWNTGLKGTGLQCRQREGWAPNKGNKHSDETRSKMSDAHKGKIVSAETRANMSAARLGKPNSYLLGRKHSAETCAKKSAALKGKPNPRARKVMTYYGVYASLGQVSLAANVTNGVVLRWMREYPKHYYFIEASK